MKSLNLLEGLESFQHMADSLHTARFALALATALVAAYAAAGMYKFFYENRGTGTQVYRAFPLLGLSITTLFICIQVSIPLSLGLLGSLSIIRFRTPIKEPEEVGFIMLVIAASVAAATFNFGFLAALYLLALLSLIITRRLRGLGFLKRDGLLMVALPDTDPEAVALVTGVLDEHLRCSQIESASTRDGLTTLQITFSGLRTTVAALHAAIRGATPTESINVFLDRPGGMH